VSPETDLAGIPWPILGVGPGGEVLISGAARKLLGFEPSMVGDLARRLEFASADGRLVSTESSPWSRARRGDRFQEIQQWRDLQSGARHVLRVRGRREGSWALLELDPEPASPALQVPERLSELNESLLARASAREAVSLRDVLHELVVLARELTGARYGALGVLDRDGASLKDFIYSGLTEEAARAIGHLPTGRGLLGAVIREGRAVRVPDMARDARAQGFPAGHPAMTTFLGVPLLVGTEAFGNFYLADKADGSEFSDADELLLARFSAQAGLTVAYARQLQDEEQLLLEAVVEHAPSGLAYFPADPLLEPFGNGAAVRMLGRVSRARDPACTFVLERPDGGPLTEEEFPVERSLREGAVINLEVLVRRRDTSTAPKPALISAAPVQARGAVLGVVVVLQDITSRKELERLREDFAAMIAHDLRTPLQAVLLQVDVLIRQAAGAAATVPVATLHRMKANGRRLELLIRDLLDASRIDARQLVLQPQRTDLAVVVTSLVGQLQAALGPRQVRLEVEDALPHVEVDPLRFEQVLTNLIENAVKYSAEGEPIRVAVSARERGVEVSVEDRGPGIPPFELPHLFDRYYQTRRARAAGQGLGLGLFIARGLVEAHHGRIAVESTPGQGSAFRVWLPSAEGPAASTGPHEGIPPGA